jgi:hypothetical protein
MIIAIHQPNYLPYLGFFDKMMRADIFVIYDNTQFNDRDFQHRNKIRTPHGWQWLTVPVESKSISIKDIKIKNETIIDGVTWKEAHFRKIRDNYKKTPYYASYEEQLKTIYENRHDKLIDLNMDIIYFLRNAFKIKTKIIFASELNFISKSTERLIDITEALGGDVYLSGSGGLNYLDESLFERRGIRVEMQDFKHPIYKQRYEGFMPNMSGIDGIFNLGEMPS